MSRFYIFLVLCVFCNSSDESLLKCNITLRYTYYEYVLNATCETRCQFPLLGTLTFRDLQVTPREFDNSNAWVGRASLTITGSFWGEYLDCRLPGHLLICVTLVTVNATIAWHCNGRNGIWPPFPGPFLNETTDEYEDNYDRLVTVDPEEKNDTYFDFGGSLHNQRENMLQKPYTSTVTETVPHKNHVTKSTCIILLAVICVLLYYLSKNGICLHRRDRQTHRSNKEKYTPLYVAIKDI